MVQQAELFAPVYTPKDPRYGSDLEKMHIPVITAPDQVSAGESFRVEVEVGKYLEHPNDCIHHIEFAELYAGQDCLARVTFTSRTSRPVATFSVTLPTPVGGLRVFIRCTVHGIWGAEKAIKVLQSQKEPAA